MHCAVQMTKTLIMAEFAVLTLCRPYTFLNKNLCSCRRTA